MKLTFDNHFEKLGEDFYKKAQPQNLKNNKVEIYSRDVCNLINLDEKEIAKTSFLNFNQKEFCNLSMNYAGHQFGNYVDVLGDGRAVLLAQVKNKNNQPYDLVLKGSGTTPYSRTYIQSSDGLSVLRSAIREYLASEALANLEIPTSRALCLISSDDFAIREDVESAAQIIRVCQSHIRFGTFERFFYNNDFENVKKLADYAINLHFPELKNNYEAFLIKVVELTAKMIAKWQAFGFCHGVMNTDNMSILGITFDYGPFGFLDDCDIDHICNKTDVSGRYSFANQPYIGSWNLTAFAVTLSNLISQEQIKNSLEKYEKFFYEEYYNLMAQKLGFKNKNQDIIKFCDELITLMNKEKYDFTHFFRNIDDYDFELKKDYHKLLKVNKIFMDEKREISNKINPKYIARNYLLENSIKLAYKKDFSEVKKLQKILQKPFDEQTEFAEYAKIPPESSKGISLSCSS